MNKKGWLLISSLLTFSVQAQVQQRQIDWGNVREGESVEYCIQHKKQAELRQNPAYLQVLAQDSIIRAHEQGNPVQKSVIYTIPVVFHILHNNGVEDITNAQIENEMYILNRDYRLQNADAAQVDTAFQGIPADVEIEFVLATKAPNGTCFNGITRTVNTLTYDGSDGSAQVDAIKAGNDVYQGEWPGNKYLNIFVCEDIGGAAGYTTNPSNWYGISMKNGIWVLHDYVGSIGTSSEYTSRTLTHEIGHWLNLSHPWGSSNNPGVSGNCSIDDGVDDTPDCMGVTSCSLNMNSCSEDNAYWGFDKKDNIENYMDYSYCSKMFTQGQVDRMRAALNSSLGGRNNIWTTSNLTAVGANNNAELCKAEFTVDRTSLCVGESISFTDESYNNPTSWSWSFPNGTPSTSTSQNPAVSYSAPGVYEVSLTVLNGSATQTVTKTQYIHVMPASASIPFFEGFENYTSLDNLTQWEVVNNNNDQKFELVNGVAHSGNNSVKLSNFDATVNGAIDELVAAPVDLSSITSATGATLSFRYAYRKKTTSDNESLLVYASTNCGETWAVRKSIPGTSLSSLTSSTSWAPSSASDWTTVHVTSLTTSYWVDNLRYKFQFTADGGNNIYLDDINIYAGSASDDIVLGIDEPSSVLKGDIELYPNPAENDLNVRFSMASAQTVQLKVKDVYGKEIQNHVIQANEGSNLVLLDTDQLSSGVYFIQVIIGGQSNVLQFVVK